MTCDRCERILLDSTNPPTIEAVTASASLLTLAQSHAQSCPACACRASDLARLHAALDQLRASTSQVEAPARVETNLLAAFRQSTTRNASFFDENLGRLLRASAAALLLLVSGVTLYMALRHRPETMVQRDNVRRKNKGPEEALRHQRPPVISGAAARKSGRTNHRRLLRPDNNPAAIDNLVARNKVPEVRVPPDEQLSLNGGSNVIRVTLPLSSLGAVGVPTYPDLPDRQVTADVAVDPFGGIIAIRLVGVKPGGSGLTK